MDNLPRTERTTLKRLPQRGNYDRELINQILDEGFICHVGFVADGQPFVIPTGYARVDDKLFIHGSQASRMLRKRARTAIDYGAFVAADRSFRKGAHGAATR